MGTATQGPTTESPGPTTFSEIDEPTGVPIRFGTDGWRAVIADDFTYENVRRVETGRPFARSHRRLRHAVWLAALCPRGCRGACGGGDSDQTRLRLHAH